MSKFASTASNKSAAPRDKRGFRGLPPPLENFSLAKLSDDTLLTTYEVSALTRVSTNTIESWRRVSGHPLRWSTIANGRIRYTVGAVRAFLAGEGRRLRAGQHEPERKPAAPAPKRTPVKPPPPRRAGRPRTKADASALQEQTP
jgi:hypothetical protein